MRTLVIDATHGGVTLSNEYARLGHDVVCADVHRTVKAIDRTIYKERFDLVDILPDPSGFDLIICPVLFNRARLEGAGGRIISHHDAVRELVSGRMNCPIVEITGSFGKTTALWAAVAILERKRSVLLLSSDGIFFLKGGVRQPLTGKVSTTPANIVRAVMLCPEEPDVAIFEVSLGGTGLSDLGIIKNVYDNYPIAQGSSNALQAKLSMVRNARASSTVMINADDPLLNGVPSVSRFSTKGVPSEVMAEKITVGADGIRFDASFDGFKTTGGILTANYSLQADPRLFGRQHVENILTGAAIAVFAGAEEEDMANLKKLNNCGSKMVLEGEGNSLRVINRSASIGPKSLERTLEDFLEVFPQGAQLCIGGRLKTTCGCADPEGVAAVINAYERIDPVTLFGEFGDSVGKHVKGKKLQPGAASKSPSIWVERG